mgnify:CR=1 FL=1
MKSPGPVQHVPHRCPAEFGGPGVGGWSVGSWSNLGAVCEHQALVNQFEHNLTQQGWRQRRDLKFGAVVHTREGTLELLLLVNTFLQIFEFFFFNCDS